MVQWRYIFCLFVFIGIFGCSKKDNQPATSISTYTVTLKDTANEFPIYLSGHIGSKKIGRLILKPWDSVFTAQTGTDIYLATSGNPDSIKNGWGVLLWIKLSCAYDYNDGLYYFTNPGDTSLHLDVKLP